MSTVFRFLGVVAFNSSPCLSFAFEITNYCSVPKGHTMAPKSMQTRQASRTVLSSRRFGLLIHHTATSATSSSATNATFYLPRVYWSWLVKWRFSLYCVYFRNCTSFSLIIDEFFLWLMTTLLYTVLLGMYSKRNFEM